MRFWLLMLGGLLIWAAHFLGLYLLSSAADEEAAARLADSWRVALGFVGASVMVVAGDVRARVSVVGVGAGGQAGEQDGERAARSGSSYPS